MPPKNFAIPSADKGPEPVSLKAQEKPVSISLKYWHSGAQCLSDWQHKELANLRKLIDKVQGLTPSQIKNDNGLYWKQHKGPPARGFSRPSALSKDIELCELRVSGKARVHGAIFENTFYLVWLDRVHEVFPDGK
ncbi:MAG6450 family protein [Microvirga lotononidis]|uniref:MAG6450 family protein n=1 Tax=Microvirga lotononidis TaxID=864069 RepID=UPI003898F844